MSKGLQLKWNNYDNHFVLPKPHYERGKFAHLNDYYLNAHCEDCGDGYGEYFFYFLLERTDVRLGEGNAPTLLLAQEGAEDALRRYLSVNGEMKFMDALEKLYGDRGREINFVNGHLVEGEVTE